jgi:hypothetical protein
VSKRGDGWTSPAPTLSITLKSVAGIIDLDAREGREELIISACRPTIRAGN